MTWLDQLVDTYNRDYSMDQSPSFKRLPSPLPSEHHFSSTSSPTLNNSWKYTSSSISSSSMEEMIQVNSPPNLYYRPITTPVSPQDMEQLRAMRVASGWYYDRIPTWINEIAAGQRLMWFIYLSDPLGQVVNSAYASHQQQHQQQSQYGYAMGSPPQSPAASPYGHYFSSTPGSSSSHSPSSAPYSSSASGISSIYGTTLMTGFNAPSSSFPYVSVSPSYAPVSSTPFMIATPGLQGPPTAQTQNSHPPIGMVCLSLQNNTDPTLASFSQTGRCEVCSLFVYSAYRHLGVGAAAMQNMEERARMMGAMYVTLNTPAVERLLRRYATMGYREYKPRRRVYSPADVRDGGLSEDYEVAAFLEKSLV
ncbi:hypothetical protein FRB91_000346 [Serendipita sp. 411]|nr:hypothetical protein FRB91_000346 [Serendipita sp. 411]